MEVFEKINSLILVFTFRNTFQYIHPPGLAVWYPGILPNLEMPILIMWLIEAQQLKCYERRPILFNYSPIGNVTFKDQSKHTHVSS